MTEECVCGSNLAERVDNLEARVAKLTKLILQSLPQFADEVDAIQSKTLG